MAETDPTRAIHEPASPPRRFGPSKRALAQRRALRWLAALLLLGLLLEGLQGDAGTHLALRVFLMAALAGAAWWGFGARLLDPLLERELVIQDQALELRRGAFKRLVVYESLRHVKVVQGGPDRLVSLRLDLEDDSVLLRDLEGLPEAFAAVAGSKPESAVIEIEEHRIDWGEPLPWALLATALALAVTLAALT